MCVVVIAPGGTSYIPDPRYLALGEGFADVVEPERFPMHRLRFKNDRAAGDVGLAELSLEEWERAFAEFEPLEGNLPAPLALRYHGHQFGVYNPHLGDGRGFLYAQARDRAGRLLDLATKGSGTTPWSRGGDGRLTLKGGVREVLAAEMLEALGVPTSRALSLFETGEALMRGDEPSPTRSSVLVRLGHSHVRFGTFQRLSRAKDEERMRRLVDHCVDVYFPDLAELDEVERPLALLDRASMVSAELTARWMAAGFCHGVLNTDNMTITGESFDYGPWRFVPRFDPEFVAAYFDGTGLYAFGRQPAAVGWNIARLADALRLVAPTAALGAPVEAFEPRYEAALVRATVRRLGVTSAGPELDSALSKAAWSVLARPEVRFERFFFDHFGRAGGKWDELDRLLEVYEPLPVARTFDREGPCEMLIADVEEIWSAIDLADDWTLFERKVTDVRDAGLAYGF
jgi:uncharacterized protein YdiU (UPF0061 family)